MTQLPQQSPDLTARNIDALAALFPSVITESRDEHGQLRRAINFEQLRQLLTPDVLAGDEAYEFTWVGKKAAMVEANRPIRKTLRPCKEESKAWDTTENLYIEGDNLDVLKLLQESGKPVSELAACMKMFPQILVNVRFTEGSGNPLEHENVKAVMAEVEAALGNRGRVLLRKSGTEPLIRVMVEGEHEEQVHEFAHRIADAVKNA